MSTTQLIQELEKEDYILPKDILGEISEEDLIKQINEIYLEHPLKLKNDVIFRNRYMELIAYLFFLNSQKKGTKNPKPFSDSLIEYLLSLPEAN